jgi:glycosyltransferase involved in cell wall biosynthesis
MSVKLTRRHQYDLSFSFSAVPAGVIGLLVGKLTGLPSLVSLQGPDVPGFESRYRLLYPFLKPLLRAVWRNAAVVTATSREHRNLAARTAPGLEIAVVENGVDTRLFTPPDVPRKSEVLEILCVGRLIERKGQHHLLRALANLNKEAGRAHLTLVGTGDAGPRLRRMAEELGLEDDVTFAGVVPPERMPAVYRSADVFVLPSENEGMSLALLEAMASGLPVIVTDTGGTAELVREGVNGCVVRWGDVDALTRAAAGLMRDLEARGRMGIASRAAAEQFSVEQVSRKYLDLCRQVSREPECTSVS